MEAGSGVQSWPLIKKAATAQQPFKFHVFPLNTDKLSSEKTLNGLNDTVYTGPK